MTESHQEPHRHHLTAMATSRESWRLAMAYIHEEFPPPIIAPESGAITQGESTNPEAKNRTRPFLQAFRRHKARLPTPLPRVRPAE